LSFAVSRLRETIDDYLMNESAQQAILWLTAELGLPAAAATTLSIVDLSAVLLLMGIRS
jgi:hypothetical protein